MSILNLLKLVVIPTLQMCLVSLKSPLSGFSLPLALRGKVKIVNCQTKPIKVIVLKKGMNGGSWTALCPCVKSFSGMVIAVMKAVNLQTEIPIQADR